VGVPVTTVCGDGEVTLTLEEEELIMKTGAVCGGFRGRMGAS
jgi:hypothetical protein